jgi:NAD(P)-dependent dehydrogenase (short-subunit alcohol dehydrogenase family)
MHSSTADIAAAAAVNGVQAAARSTAARAATAVAGRQAEPRIGEPVQRLALVTGAARRLGRTIALALAHDGWDIGVHYATSEKEARQTANDIRALGRQAVCLKANLEDAQAALGLVRQLSEQLGPVSGLVNNASRFVHDDIGTLDAASLTAHLMPNLVAPLLLSQAFYRALGDSAGDATFTGEAPAGETSGGGASNDEPSEGVIINLLDQKLDNLNPDFFSYTVAKAGLAAATTMLAQAMAPRVRVVGIAPGLTLPSYLQDADAFAQAHRSFSPLGRSSTPEDVAAAVVFAMNNRSLTGTVIQVDGGQHLHRMPRDASCMPAGDT